MRTDIVVIGRDEGERPMRCVRAPGGSGARVAYGDSGTTDRSAARAREWGAEGIEKMHSDKVRGIKLTSVRIALA